MEAADLCGPSLCGWSDAVRVAKSTVCAQRAFGTAILIQVRCYFREENSPDLDTSKKIVCRKLARDVVLNEGALPQGVVDFAVSTAANARGGKLKVKTGADLARSAYSRMAAMSWKE